LPFELTPLSNAASPWILFAFAAALIARQIRHAVVLSITAQITLVTGFYAAQATRGWPVDGHQIASWCVTTIVVGPLIGLAAGWLRYASDARSAVGAVLSATLTLRCVRGCGG
jgi:type III secretory pathway component EscT